MLKNVNKFKSAVNSEGCVQKNAVKEFVYSYSLQAGTARHIRFTEKEKKGGKRNKKTVGRS